MPKLITFFSTFIIVLIGFIQPVFAQNFGYQVPNPSQYDSLEEILNAAGSLIRPVFIITFGAMIIYAAFILLTSQGDEEKVGNARKTIVAAIIGFAIAVLAPTIANIVLNFLGVQGIGF